MLAAMQHIEPARGVRANEDADSVVRANENAAGGVRANEDADSVVRANENADSGVSCQCLRPCSTSSQLHTVGSR